MRASPDKASICVVALLAVGCHQDRYEIRPGGSEVYATPIRISANSHIIDTVDLVRPATVATLKKNIQRDEFGVPQLTAEAMTPCGWQVLSGPTHQSPDGYLFVAFSARTLHILYDNRGMTGSVLAVGPIELPLPDNGIGEGQFITEGCHDTLHVMIGGRAIGRFDPTDVKAKEVVVDVSGKHCYIKQRIAYATAPNTAAVSELPQKVSGQSLYLLSSRIDRFLETPPATIRSIMPAESRNTWTDSPCV